MLMLQRTILVNLNVVFGYFDITGLTQYAFIVGKI